MDQRLRDLKEKRISDRLFLSFLWLFLGAILLVWLAGCTTPKSNGKCDTTADPNDRDIKYALNRPGDIFQNSDWDRKYTVGDQRISITWEHTKLSGLAYLEYLVWDCGYTQKDLETYFSESNFTNVFFNAYENPVRVKHCSLDDTLSLYEYTAMYEGINYLLRYWVNLDSPTRIMTFLLSFPEKDKAVLDQVANQLYPKLAVCP
jgi:hypothetical protein